MKDNNEYILSDDVKRTKGKDAQRQNILVAKMVANAVSSTLGPKGMDKLIMEPYGKIIVTNDGVTILREMKIEHPIAKMIVEIAKTQEEEVGDGTTSCVVLAGEFLKQAETLLEKGIHPTTIAKGYRIAEEKCQEIVTEIAEDVSLDTPDILKKIAMTAMTGKGSESKKELLADLVVLGAKSVSENGLFDLNNIKISTVSGRPVSQSRLIDGIILEQEKAHNNMPSSLTECGIALLSCDLNIDKIKVDSQVQITDPSKIKEFIMLEQEQVKQISDFFKESGVDVIICERGIDEKVAYNLAKIGILALRRIPRSDIEKVAKATGSHIVSDYRDLTINDIGFAGKVYQEQFGQEIFTLIEMCPHPKAISLLICGNTEHILDEIKRSVTDALGDVASALRCKKVVAGAGAVEMEISKRLREFADTISGKEQFAVLSYAESLEIIPLCLAENSGLDAIDVITKLRAEHKKNNKWIGVNVFTGEPMNAWEEGVLEPLQTKTQALSSATEVAEMILRIDDVFLGTPRQTQEDIPEDEMIRRIMNKRK